MSFAFVFPGQGSQALGMSKTLAEAFSVVQETYQEASDALGYDLWALCQDGPIERLSQTECTQPALLTAGVASFRAWQSAGGALPSAMAGHSLGEYTALTCAGALSFADAVTLVRDRGKYMQQAVPEGQGGMAAVLGLDSQVVIDVCEQVSSDSDSVQAVNFNAPGQVVIAGSAQGIENAVAALKTAGAKRAMPLPVSIPAHSRLMTPACEQLRARIDQIEVTLPSVPVLHNTDLSVAADVETLKHNLIEQLHSPVRWVETIEKMAADGVDSFVESGPGKVLSGMIKRIAPSAEVAAINDPDQIHQLI